MALPRKSSYLMGGTFDSVPPTLNDGDFNPLELDVNGNLKVTVVSGGGSGSNAAAGLTGSAVPTSADYIGVNVSGILRGVTGFSLNAGNTIPAAVAIVDGSGNQITSFGGGSQFAMGSVQSSSALGTIALGYDGTNVRGLLTSNTGQLHTIIDSATLGTVTITGSVSVSNFPATQNVAITSPVDGSGFVEVDLKTALPAGTNVIGHVIVDSGAITVSGTVTDNQGAPNTLANAWPVEVTDGTNVLGTATHPIRVDPTGTTTQPVSGTVAVSNFPATQSVSGTVTANQGTPNTVSNAWPTELVVSVGGTLTAVSGNNGSGTSTAIDVNIARLAGSSMTPTVGLPISDNNNNGPVAVKAASTRAVAIDPSFVVALSPNSPVGMQLSSGVGPVSGFALTNTNATAVAVVDGAGTQIGYSVAHPFVNELTDGVSGPVAVKPANIIPLATDAALVVTISPNSQDTRGLTDLLQTLILEVRAMRTAVVYAVTENGDVFDKDFDPASQDFQPLN